MSSRVPRWGAFTLLCATYLSATVGEQLLSPLFPTARTELGMSKGDGGVAFGVLALAIAVFTMVGGAGLRRWSVVAMVRISCLFTAAGAVMAATAGGLPTILAAQILLGSGAGLFFPAGLQGVALFAGPNRRGFAMGLYGVAFSGGLTVAALFGALGATTGWRVPFWISAALAVAALCSLTAISGVAPTRAVGFSVPWRAVFGLPTIVGTVGAILQYGVLAFFATYAVDEWDLSEARAATVLAVGRVISIVAKVVGGATVDRIGARASMLRTGVVLSSTGVIWTLLPAGWATFAVAAIFAGTVSSIFPAANVMAVERFGGDGLALGAYRSVQIGIGALAGIAIGNSPLGLRWTVFIGVLTPISLLWFCRPQRDDRPPRRAPRDDGARESPPAISESALIWESSVRTVASPESQMNQDSGIAPGRRSRAHGSRRLR